MKTISIKNPWGYLICANIKPIENRTWQTNVRCRVLVHVSAKPVSNIPNPLSFKQWNSLSPDQKLLLRSNSLPNSAIIGSVEIVDCVENHLSIWAEKAPLYNPDIHEFMPRIYNWVLANPVLFAKPITNVKGKLSFWDYDLDVCHICGQPTEFICKVCERPYCENHQANFNQFTQIDYNCCSDCADSKKWGE